MTDIDTGASNPNQRPDYADSLAAFHRAFEPELRDVVASLPLSPAHTVLDLACGDGFYSALLAERLNETGKIVGTDTNKPLLEEAIARFEGGEFRCKSHFVQEEMTSLNGKYDLIWCAQSLFSLPEPVEAIRTMMKALKPAGKLVVLENDSLHQLFLPWSSELELAIRRAEREQYEADSDHPQKFYIGRRLPSVFARAGLTPLTFRTQAIDRRAPLGADLWFFLDDYLKSLAKKLEPFLQKSYLEELRSLVGSKSPFRSDPYFTMTWINTLTIGEKATA